MKKTVLREYARLIVKKGVNVQKGQEVLIYADLDQPEFVAMVVEEAYKAKAKKVSVEWNYQPLTKLHVRYRSVTTMGTVEDWEKARQQHYVDVDPFDFRGPGRSQGHQYGKGHQGPPDELPHSEALQGSAGK